MKIWNTHAVQLYNYLIFFWTKIIIHPSIPGKKYRPTNSDDTTGIGCQNEHNCKGSVGVTTPTAPIPIEESEWNSMNCAGLLEICVGR
jgi:hypothetical protein